MNEIKLIVKEKEIVFNTPSSWDELTQEQMVRVAKAIPLFMTGWFDPDLLMFLLGLNKKAFKLIPPVEKYELRKTFDFLIQKPKMKKLIVETFKYKGIQYIGYQAGFSNITWEEFITAERYFMNNEHTIAAAVLYRQERENYNGESDPRIPFSVYGTEKRAETFQHLDHYLISAIALNYFSLRETYITNRYKNVFGSSSGNNGGKSLFSWINITRTILGEDFFEEKKILKSNVHTVLHRLNTLFDPKNKKKGKK